MPKITKREVDKITPSTGDVFVWDSGDGAIKGFGVRMKPSGSASYLVQYRNREGRTRRIVLGRVGVLPPDEARDLAIEKLRAVAHGADPSADRHATRQSLTVKELCELYLKESAGRVKASTLTADKSRIEAHVIPLLGFRAVAGLTRQDLEKFQKDVANGKTGRLRTVNGRLVTVKGGRGVAARSLGMLGTILEFGRGQGCLADNPARGIRKFPDKKRRRFLSAEEIFRFGAALREERQAGGAQVGVAALEALILTGCRRDEILRLPRAWLDAKAQCIRFEDTKTGANLRPIGRTAAQFLDLQLKTTNSDWVFPSTRFENRDSPGHFVGLRRVLVRICKRSGLEDVTIHTLRHTFAATAAEMGFSELTIAGLLGHCVRGVTARYAHVPDSALVAAADAVSARIAGMLIATGLADGGGASGRATGTGSKNFTVWELAGEAA